MAPLHRTAFKSLILVGAAVAPFAFAFPTRNDGIHLAVHPQCGTLGGNFTDVNAGIDLSSIRTIVTFGVSLMALYLPRPSRKKAAAHGRQCFCFKG